MLLGFKIKVAACTVFFSAVIDWQLAQVVPCLFSNFSWNMEQHTQKILLQRGLHMLRSLNS